MSSLSSIKLKNFSSSAVSGIGEDVLRVIVRALAGDLETKIGTSVKCLLFLYKTFMSYSTHMVIINGYCDLPGINE